MRTGSLAGVFRAHDEEAMINLCLQVPKFDPAFVCSESLQCQAADFGNVRISIAIKGAIHFRDYRADLGKPTLNYGRCELNSSFAEGYCLNCIHSSHQPATP